MNANQHFYMAHGNSRGAGVDKRESTSRWPTLWLKKRRSQSDTESNRESQ